MTLVPEGAGLEVEALVLNKDVGFVEVGQEAVVRVDAFPFTRYGTLSGRVTRVSTDALESKEALAAPGSNTGSRASGSEAANAAPRTQGLVYPITVALDRADMLVDGRPIPLAPGMVVTVEVRTGRRRILEYLLSPIVEVTATALKER